MNQPTERTRKIYRATWIGMVVNIALSLLKLAAGILGRSGAMIADAVHSISDLATDVIVLIFARISSKPEDAGHNYGHGKYETLASILISLTLIAVGGGILADSIRNIRLVLTGEIIGRPGAIALIAAAISIVAKEVLYRYTVRVGRQTDSPSVVANAWHHRSDALSSIGTLTGIGLAYFLGDKWRIADPLAALVVSVFIFKIAFDLLRSGLGELLEHALPAATEQEILKHPDPLEGGDRTAPSAHTPYRSHRRHRSPYPRRSSDERAPLPSTDRRYRTPAQRAIRPQYAHFHSCRTDRN